MRRITDPAVRAAAERFERETGRKISEELPHEEHEGIIELYLIASGYAPMRPGDHAALEAQAAVSVPVIQARAALGMIREALEQYGAIAGLPDLDSRVAPSLADEAEEYVAAIIRLGEALIAVRQKLGPRV